MALIVVLGARPAGAYAACPPARRLPVRPPLPTCSNDLLG
jgi:hypothetical protein